MKRHARIIGTGLYAPERIMKNAEFSTILEEDIEEFVGGKLNILERRIMAEDESPATMAVQAAQAALEKAGCQAQDLDLLIVATDTPETISPATCSKVQHLLGAKNAGTFDVNCACAAFVTGVDIAAKYISSDDQYEHILVVATYGMTRFLDFHDRYTATIFADGAGAVVMQAGDQPGFLASKLIADGSYHDFMGIYAGGALNPITPERIERGEHLVRFVKKFPEDTNATHWPILIKDILNRIGKTLSDIDFVLFTQININTIREVMDELGLPWEKTHTIMDHFGYTGSACIPMALDEVARSKRIKDGDLVLLVGSGGGYAMGAIALNW
ncbi:MAG: ketoacyl-ACP synthase III [Candidatus Marinimicrobia bacterium]|jgi:3-oxoacyl-[acyl-carrier-protein] synthase III|nr:ketoacyl-ACP synthase III [Candidatus Neomarinimicrobiota bacterium]MBT4360650.1 ketoacyl-ACP synthase III [Candidatus Neomarinimicrobiota bacterium]MBT4715932.1 ketoacyl-ACP synthase III [Candidatus Neomarinimicrobiota bacterium]MBT4948135.1 ketoacyl-ACP synthase III [Candidatus Neomarinimicrobiota bacterium]MBT5271017.1 ketoacyl-ACP synthase III [Candidatus Neomarinimicrobiota bacterium]